MKIYSLLLLYALKLRPTAAKTAARLDSLGLEERISTMAAFWDDPSPICAVQRRDAAARLATISPKRLSIRFPKRAATLCLALALLMAGVSALPYASQYTPEQTEPEEARLAREILAELRARVENASVSEEERAELLAQIAELEAGVEGGNISLEDLAQISEATGEIYKELEDIEAFVSWAFQLTSYPSLRELGEAVLSGDTEAMSTACANMSNGLVVLSGTPLVDALMERSLAIREALEKGNPTDDEAYLCYIFDSLSLDLQTAATYAFSGKNAESLIIQGLQRAEKRLYMHFTGEDVLEAAEEDADENVNYLQMQSDEISEAMAFGASETDLESGEGEKTLQTLYSADPDDWVGAGVGTRGEQYHAVTEMVYEPSLDPSADQGYVPGEERREAEPREQNAGSVPYGQVYATYYAELLSLIENGDIPAELMDAVEAYFYGM